MIKKRFTGSARRARNIVWNAAGRYDFEPPFLAFFPNGTPDNYFNMVVGLTQKWLDLSRIWDFFARYGADRRAEEFDELLWLGIENCVYEKELAERPVLEALRSARAEKFYEMHQRMTRQQMEMQSMLVYTQQEARWAAIAGRGAILTPREKRMAEALRFPGTLDTDGVLDAMTAFLRDFFRFAPDASTAEKPRRGGMLAKLLLRHEHRRHDRLLVRTGTGEGDHPRAVQLHHINMGRHVGPTEKDAAFVRTVFGECALSEHELRTLENELCAGDDEGCRLWVTRGADAPDAARAEGEAADVRKSAAQQKTRNEAFLAEHANLVQGSIRRLSTRIDTILSSYLRHMPEPARAGRIRSEAAYRLPVLHDARVFLKNGEEIEPEISVDLLLDASQSRMNWQEVLASEAYIIAKSLEKARIPVRVCAFRSLRGYTVVEELKDYAGGCEGVLRYFAGGWNRDALALETLGRLDDDAARGRQRILLVLTDASPNDSTPLAAQGLLLAREYEGAAAVKAAEDAVRRLRADGVRVGAVFHGSTAHLANVNQIYGHAYVRIQKAAQLAQGVSDLLLMLLREARTD